MKIIKNYLYVFLVTLLLVTPVLAIGCVSEGGSNVALAAHRRQWVSQGIGNYSYQLQIVCFCPPEVTGPVIIEVRDGLAVSVVNSATGIAVEGAYLNNSDTIEDIFLIIEEALKRDADEMTVIYEESYGFPTQIKIDFIKQAVDDEITYIITQFQVLK